jgi:hypothetical protein
MAAGTRPYVFSVFRMVTDAATQAPFSLTEVGVEASFYYQQLGGAGDLRVVANNGAAVANFSTSDLAVHAYEMWADGALLHAVVDGTDTTAAFAGTAGGAIDDIGVGYLPHGATQVTDANHALHIICASVPSADQRAALLAMARATWGTP